MPNHLNFQLTTVRGGGPPVKVVCSCDDFWSVAQQNAMLELYPRIPRDESKIVNLCRESVRIIPMPPEPKPFAHPDGLPMFETYTRGQFERLMDVKMEQLQAPVPDWSRDREQLRELVLNPVAIERYQRGGLRYATRARLIARAYACVFLETIHHGNPKLLGRFYWAGLAAFASKQVACTLEKLIVRGVAPATVRALGKGNLWLYNDAWPWHYAWALCPKSVRKCADQRDARNLHPVVLSNFNAQEWAKEVVPCTPWHIDEQTGQIGEPIGQFRIAPLMAEAIEGWQQIEAETKPSRRRALCMTHLWAMARHEQGEVLQGLVYSDDDLIRDLERGRFFRDRMRLDRLFYLFKLQLSFSAEEYTDDDEFRSEAPRGIALEHYKERMDWIKNTAQQYDDLMYGKKRQRMLAELRKLAEWDG